MAWSCSSQQFVVRAPKNGNESQGAESKLVSTSHGIAERLPKY
jgi:hypothetical protein